MITPSIITAPIQEAISLAELKAQLRLDASGTSEDGALGIFRTAARQWFEWRTGRAVHQTTLEYVLDAWPGDDYIILPRATPLIAISSAKYKNSSAVETTWSSAEYIADLDNIPGRLVLGYNYSWPSFTAYPSNPIRIRYSAGITTASPVTEADPVIKLPILMLAAGLYANRESEVITDRARIEAIAIKYGVVAFIERNVVSYVF